SVAVSVATAHPGYDPSMLRNDVAVLKLSAPVTGPGIGFVKLPAAGNRKYEKTGQAALAAGWGATFEGGGPVNDLREVTLPIYNFSHCRKIWATGGLKLNSAHVCAFAVRKDTCQGDSGGPLFVRTANAVYQVGITSFGYGCASQIPGVYTRLSNASIGNFVRNMMKQ
ncbi:MAG: serine protease, partial [Thermomicrobiales bacterium]